MWRHLGHRLSLLAILVLASTARAEEAPVHDLVITGLPQPVRVALQITCKGEPWQKYFDATQRRYRQAVFAHIDQDGDGRISAADARRLPKPRMIPTASAQSDVHVAFNYRVIDDDGDGDVSPAEYERYATSFGNPSLSMTAVTTTRPDVDLFRALDTNRDRILTAAEWSAAEKLLANDRDGNRVLTADELRPPMSAVGPPEFVAGGRVARKPLALDLKSPSADPEAVVSINFGDDGSVAPRLTLTLSAGAAERGIRIEQGVERDPVLVVDGRRLVLRVQLPIVRDENALQRELQQDFDTALERSGGKVFIKTQMSPRLLEVFLLADSNADGQLEQAEFDLYRNTILPLRVAADATGLVFVNFGERAGLTPFVDLNLDGRLSLREIRGIPARLNALAGKQAQLVRDELPGTLLSVLQRVPQTDATGRPVLQQVGPPWFFRADRNQDGDLDRAEFLGTPEDFNRLDTNEDGWIELDEALSGAPTATTSKPEGRQ